MSPLIDELLAHAPAITDGAWGTQLQARGLPAGESPDAWNLVHPEQVEGVARAYVEAGSDIILTNTFGANRIALAAHGLAARTFDLNLAGAAASRRAACGRARVFGSIGPTGKLLALDEVSDAEARDAFQEQAHALVEGGVDGLVIETMSDLREAKAAVMSAVDTGVPVVACMVYGAGKAGDHTMMGVTPEQAAAELTAAGADVIGANCGDGPGGFLPICARLRAATTLPLWIKPNAGVPDPALFSSGGRGSIGPEAFAARAKSLVEAGADFIGGCCGTDPAFVRALVQALQQWRR